LIDFEQVSKIYDPGVAALSDVTVKIERGEFVFLVGPSGSGKSTFIRLVIAEEPSTQGSIRVADQDLAALKTRHIPHFRRNLGCVFQDFKLLDNKTVAENVAFAQEAIGTPRGQIAQNVPEVLELVGLWHKANAYPHEISGGEQQRVSIARAFVNRPQLVLCDEPTGNLDPTTSAGIMRLLDRINRAGATVMMATHDHHIVDSMRRRVVELDDGRVVRDEDRGVYGYVH